MKLRNGALGGAALAAGLAVVSGLPEWDWDLAVLGAMCGAVIGVAHANLYNERLQRRAEEEDPGWQVHWEGTDTPIGRREGHVTIPPPEHPLAIAVSVVGGWVLVYGTESTFPGLPTAGTGRVLSFALAVLAAEFVFWVAGKIQEALSE